MRARLGMGLVLPSGGVPPELVLLLAIGFAARLAIFYLLPNVHWPDEIYQVMEPAHRLVFGAGVTSWEWVAGIRSWLLPGFVAGLMELGRVLGSSPALINLPVAVFMAAAGCVPVACGYGWGRQLHGRAGGFAAAAVAAVWVDLVYMSGHTLTDVVAADCLPAALYVGASPTGGPPSRARLWWTGGLLGLTLALRFQLAPALLVAAIWICGAQGRRWRALVAGACIPVLALGLLDWATLGMPFRSVTINLWYNLWLGGAYGGREPFLTLWVLPLQVWGLAGFAAVVMTAIVGARRLPLPALVALAIIATYSLVPHKEYRFAYPAIVLLTLLAGVGTAELLGAAAQHLPRRAAMPGLAAGLCLALWAALSWSVAERPIFNTPWTRSRAPLLAFADISADRAACGVGLYDWPWIKTPGMSGLTPGISLWQTDSADLRADSAGFNYILASAQTPVPDARYRRAACFGGDRSSQGVWQTELCVWHRGGGCATARTPRLPVNWPRALQPHRVPRPAAPWENAENER
jgi:hypothetical protein